MKTPGLKMLVLIAALALASERPLMVRAEAPSATPAPSAIQFKPEGPESGGLALRVVGGLVLAAMVAAGVIYGLRKFAPWIPVPGSRTGKGSLRLVDSMRLTQKLTLFVVEYEADRILLAFSDRGVTVLSSTPAGGRSGDHER